MNPEGFTVALALTDALPVIFFCGNCIVIGRLLDSVLFFIGAMFCLLGGSGKVLWKLIVAVGKEDVRWLFFQMRVLMPAGFALMILALILCRDRMSLQGILGRFLSFPSIIFFLIGIAGMVLMSVFAIKLDSGSARSNRIEQLTNGIAQAAIFVGLLLV